MQPLLTTISRWILITPDITPENPEIRGAIVRFKAPREKDAKKCSLYQYLYQYGSHHDGPYSIAGSLGGDSDESGKIKPETENLRLCPTIYNLKKHIDVAIEAMNQWPTLQ